MSEKRNESNGSERAEEPAAMRPTVVLSIVLDEPQLVYHCGGLDLQTIGGLEKALGMLNVATNHLREQLGEKKAVARAEEILAEAEAEAGLVSPKKRSKKPDPPAE